MEPPAPDVLEWLQKVHVPTIVAVAVIGLLLRSCYRCLTKSKKNGTCARSRLNIYRSQAPTTVVSPAADPAVISSFLVVFLKLWTVHGELEEDNESVNENDADLNKSLNKQRRHAVAAAPGEQRRSIASRSTYKDKGGKSSQNSRMQRQLCSW
ncbi:hypothetical protein Peur_066140 [Populus x canadensis]